MSKKIDIIVNKIKERTNKVSIICSPFDYQQKLKLSDNVILYTTGEGKWKIISLDIMLRYSIIYDIFQDEEENKNYDCSIIVCPISLQAVMLIGLFTIQTYINNVMILAEKETNALIPINVGLKISESNIIIKSRRIDIKIMRLRDAIIFAPDACFGYTDDKLDDFIINVDYYSDKLDIEGHKLDGLIHPKTLTYIIQYKSSKGREKNVILLGKDSNKDIVTGYNMKNSEISKYLGKYRDKIINREGYLMPILWYIAKSLYINAKVINVD